jgi:hypothetical protein
VALRKIVVPIDSILDMFKSYTAENHEIPADAKPVTLMFKPAEQGKFAIVATSEEWNGTEPPLVVNFDIQRSFLV